MLLPALRPHVGFMKIAKVRVGVLLLVGICILLPAYAEQLNWLVQDTARRDYHQHLSRRQQRSHAHDEGGLDDAWNRSPVYSSILSYFLDGNEESAAFELCQAFSGRTLAIVGNGPLEDEARLEIEQRDIVIRFNSLANM